MSKKGESNIRGWQVSYQKATPNFLKQFKHQEEEKVAEKEKARELKRADVREHVLHKLINIEF